MSLRRSGSWFGVLLLVLGCGCRDRQPPDRYPRNLGTAEVRLLPSSYMSLAARNPEIRQGKANIVKRGDTGAAAAAARPPQGGMALPSKPAGSMAEAVGNIGMALLGNLVGGAATQQPGGAAPPPGARPAAPEAGGELNPQDAEAIRAVFARYQTASSERNYAAVQALHVEAEQNLVRMLNQEEEELYASFQAFAAALEQKSPGSKARVTALIDELYKPDQLTELNAAGPDAALGMAGGNAYRFHKTGTEWRVSFEPQLTEQQTLMARRGYQANIEWAEALTDAVLEGQTPPAQALTDFTARIQALIAASRGT